MSEHTRETQRHGWQSHRLAAQILRAWVRETMGELPAWTTPAVYGAYTTMLSGCEAVIAATQAADKDATRG